jgi:glucose/arabinose dehydrogenase
MRKTALLIATFAFVLLGVSSASAQSVQLVPFGGQSFPSPRYVAGPPGDSSRVFIVQGEGIIRLVKDGSTQAAPFLDINGDVLDQPEGGGGCECGLFSMAFAPDYATSGLFYVYYTRDDPAGEHFLRIEEFRRSAANPDVADPGSRRIVLEIPHLADNIHNGGQLQFGPDKFLYAATGDGGSGQSGNAQNGGSQLGKLLRIDPRSGATGIYSSGLRNPFRFSFDRSTGDLTIGDVGQEDFEEVDYKPEGAGAGANFGWDCFEGNSVQSGCSVPNHSGPVLVYPNPLVGPAAVIGGYVIRDSALPGLIGRYIYADFSDAALGGQIHTAVLSAGGASGDAPLLGASQVISFGQDACGHIYVVQDDGSILRLQPTSGGFPCKTAPGLAVEKKSARKAAKKGAVVIRATCDEDCDLAVKATIVLKGGNDKAASAKRKKKKGRGITAKPVSTRLQLGQKTRLSLDLSKKKTKRIRKALAGGRKAVAKIEASATGGGGGTTTVKKKAKLRKVKPKG